MGGGGGVLEITVIGCVSSSAFVSLVCLLIGIARSAELLKT